MSTLPSNLDPTTNQIINGKLYTQVPDTSEDATAQYLGYEDAKAMHAQRGEPDWDYPKIWVPGDNSPGWSGGDIAKAIALMAAAGAGGSALAGAFGAGGAGAGAAGAAGSAGSAGTAAAGLTPTIGWSPGLAAALSPTAVSLGAPAAAAGAAGAAGAFGLPGATGIGGGSGATAAQLAMTPEELEAAAAIPGAAAGGSNWFDKVSPFVSAAGKGLSQMAAARAQGRTQQAGINLNQDQLQTQRDIANANQGNTAAGIDLQQREFRASQAKQSLANALRGGLLQGVNDVSIDVPDYIRSHVGTISGGLRPSALIGKDQIGSNLQRQALLNLMSPENTDGPYGAFNTTAGLSAPARSINFMPLSAMPQPGKLDTFLQYAGPIASILGGVGSYFGDRGDRG